MTRFIASCVCIFLLAAGSVTNGEGADDDTVERGNSYIDQMLKDMFEEDDGFEPYVMEDSSIGFNKKIMFVNVSGEAKLHDGYIKGLSTLHRSGPCSLEEKDDRLHVKADLGAGILEFHYSGTAKFMNFGPTITVEGELKYIETQMEFTVDAKTGKNGKLTKFHIDEMKGMKVWVTGLGPINWAVNPIIKGVTKVFKRVVRYVLENRVQKYISNRLPNYQFPVEGGDQTEVPLTETPKPEEVTTPTSEPEKETTQPPEPEEETTQPPEPEEETTQPPEPEEETTQPPEPEEETTQPPEPEEETTQPPEPEEETTQPPEPEEETTQPPEPEEETTQPPEEPETPAPEEPDELEESDKLEEADDDLAELKFTDDLAVSDYLHRLLLEYIDEFDKINKDAGESENSDELEYPDK